MKRITVQIRMIACNKEAVITWFTALIFVLLNFIDSAKMNLSRVYYTETYDIAKLHILSSWAPKGYYFKIIYPLIAVVPTSALFLADKKSGENMYSAVRTGKTEYFISKVAAAFWVTFIIFTIPLVIEYVLEMLCFNPESIGSPSNLPYHDMLMEIRGTVFPDLYIYNKHLYMIAMCILFGVITGIFAAFNLVIASSELIRFRIMTIMPLYVTLTVFNSVGNIVGDKTGAYSYIKIFSLFSNAKINYGPFIILIAGMLLTVVISIGFSKRKDII